MLAKIRECVERKLNLPNRDWIDREHSNWEYAQLNYQLLLEAEVDPEGLRGALCLRDVEPVEAFKLLLGFAEVGSAFAMNQVGEDYRWGQFSVAQDEARAERWFEKAFKAGSQRGLLNYGKLLWWHGDYSGDETVFRKGAEDGWSPALYWLARTRLDQSQTADVRSEARVLLERAAEQGHPAARWRLARDMAWGRSGLRGVPAGFKAMAGVGRDTRIAWDARPQSVFNKT